MKNILYLASGSSSRKRLLTQAVIPFQVIEQHADESVISTQLPLRDLVTQLAILKMEHVVMPDGKDGDIAFVLTADTMTLDDAGDMHGKPVDRDDARRMLVAVRAGSTIGTGFCLEKKIFQDGKWVQQDRIIGYESARCIFDVPDRSMDFYLDHIPFTQVSGGVTIEGFSEQFLRTISGNYSAIIGLPMYELREALHTLGFYGD